MELDYKSLGKRIKEARVRSGFTQEELAEKASLSVTHLSNVENGTTHISLTALVELANVMGFTVDDLLCDSIVHARVQIERDISLILADCDDYEIRIISDMAAALKQSLRKDKRLRNE